MYTFGLKRNIVVGNIADALYFLRSEVDCQFWL